MSVRFTSDRSISPVGFNLLLPPCLRRHRSDVMVLVADLVVLPFVGRVSVVSKPVRVGSISLPVFVTSAVAYGVS